MKRHVFLSGTLAVLAGLFFWKSGHHPATAPAVTAATEAEEPARETSATAPQNRVPIDASASATRQKEAAAPTPPAPPVGGGSTPLPVASDGPAPRPFAPRAPAPIPWARYEPRLNNRLNDRDFNDTLKQVRPGNLQPYVSSGSPMVFPAGASFPALNSAGAPVAGGGLAPAPTPAVESPNPLTALFGRFEGSIQPLQDGRPWSVTLLLAGKVEEGKLRGDCTIELLRDGQLVSRVTQNGELSVVQQGPEGSNAIWLKPNDQFHYQLYYRKDRDEWGGNFYRRVDADHLPAVGRISLHRRAEAESAPRTAR